MQETSPSFNCYPEFENSAHISRSPSGLWFQKHRSIVRLLTLVEFLQPGWIEKIPWEGVGWALIFEESFKLKGISRNLCSKSPTRAKQGMLFRALEVMSCFSSYFQQLLAFHGSSPNWKCVFIAVFYINPNNTSCLVKSLVWGFEWQLLTLQVRKHAV